jgi:hypothetical protein
MVHCNIELEIKWTNVLIGSEASTDNCIISNHVKAGKGKPPQHEDKEVLMEVKLHIIYYFCGGVRLSPLGTSSASGPTLPAPDDR